jgi:hypothetical protein
VPIYRIKSSLDNHERVTDETQLSRAILLVTQRRAAMNTRQGQHRCPYPVSASLARAHKLLSPRPGGGREENPTNA